jgi:hypothetical protein
VRQHDPYELHFFSQTLFSLNFCHSGDAVYCRVVSADPDLEPELSCMVPGGTSNGLGELKGDGVVFDVSLGEARELRVMLLFFFFFFFFFCCCCSQNIF